MSCLAPRSRTADEAQAERIASLERENAQLRQAITSHATVDQALGVLLAVYRFAPADGFELLREVSQRTNLKLHIVAQAVLDWALGQPLPSTVGRELDTAVERDWRAAEEYRCE
ncbi:hypothetical protein GCM10010423_69390 [Streptomyces levis]|uniref:ANTAR domain-containing protein n=1 Tax=Streptomyces levis TaxID=285566 RepID=A0ABP6BJ72_9ACTN